MRFASPFPFAAVALFSLVLAVIAAPVPMNGDGGNPLAEYQAGLQQMMQPVASINQYTHPTTGQTHQFSSMTYHDGRKLTDHAIIHSDGQRQLVKKVVTTRHGTTIHPDNDPYGEQGIPGTRAHHTHGDFRTFNDLNRESQQGQTNGQ